MNLHTQLVGLFLSTTVVFAAPAVADIVGLVVEDKTDSGAAALDLSVCAVYVEFDDGDDRLASLAASDIDTDDPAGFYQHAYGTDKAPLEVLVRARQEIQ